MKTQNIYKGKFSPDNAKARKSKLRQGKLRSTDWYLDGDFSHYVADDRPHFVYYVYWKHRPNNLYPFTSPVDLTRDELLSAMCEEFGHDVVWEAN